LPPPGSRATVLAGGDPAGYLLERRLVNEARQRITEPIADNQAVGDRAKWVDSRRIRSVAEYNFFIDPEAARIVFEAGFNVTLTFPCACPGTRTSSS
jgi:hypothetical protein